MTALTNSVLALACVMLLVYILNQLRPAPVTIRGNGLVTQVAALTRAVGDASEAIRGTRIEGIDVGYIGPNGREAYIYGSKVLTDEDRMLPPAHRLVAVPQGAFRRA